MDSSSLPPGNGLSVLVPLAAWTSRGSYSGTSEAALQQQEAVKLLCVISIPDRQAASCPRLHTPPSIELQQPPSHFTEDDLGAGDTPGVMRCTGCGRTGTPAQFSLRGILPRLGWGR